jgi:cell division protein FtsL
MTLALLSAVLMLSLGALLGTAWTTQASQPKLRRQAEERRRLNNEWSALRAARQQQRGCPRCGNLRIDRTRQESRRCSS